ncbi:MAG: hypothetical protein ACJ8AD_14840 [Gemmatimonadaceae bacterium]
MYALYIIIILLCAIINYGAGRYEWMLPRDKADPQRTKRLPGRPLYYATAAIGALAATVLHWHIALAVVAAFVAWRGPSWGHLYQLGHVIPTRPMPLHERICMRIGFGNPFAAAAVRHSYMLPLAALLPAAAAFPVLTVAAYELAWRLGRPVVLAEKIVGALWGAIIISGVLFNG